MSDDDSDDEHEVTKFTFSFILSYHNILIIHATCVYMLRCADNGTVICITPLQTLENLFKALLCFEVENFLSCLLFSNEWSPFCRSFLEVYIIILHYP